MITEEEAKTLYAHYGVTAYRGQCVEMEAGTLLLLYLKANDRISKAEVLDAIDRSIERQTFGALLRLIVSVKPDAYRRRLDR